MEDSAGRVSMLKQFFFSMFKPAWDKAFREETIQAAFRKTGI